MKKCKILVLMLFLFSLSILLLACWSCRNEPNLTINQDVIVQQTDNQQTEQIAGTTGDEEQKPPEEDVLPTNDDVNDPILYYDFPSSFFDDIAFNLSKEGSSDPALLVGKWDCIRYAYTEDGKTISNSESFPFNYYFEIGDEVSKNLASTSWIWTFSNESTIFLVHYALSPDFNLIKINAYQMTFNLLVLEMYEMIYGENGIVTNLFNACSYVIKGDELFIYFTGSKQNNLLIFKKKTP